MNFQNRKKMQSIDGHFSKIVNLKYFNEENKKLFLNNTIHGEGNSISKISYNTIGEMVKPNLKDKFILKKNVLICNGNAKVSDIHNFLINRKKYCPFFPSYPGVSIGACVANGVHGVNSKDGIFNDYVIEITIYNPNFGYKTLSNRKNKKLFELTKNGFGLTGIITKIKLRVFNLKYYNYKIKIVNCSDLFKAYKFIKKSSFLFNQNSFYLDYSSKEIFKGRILTGSGLKKQKNVKKLKLNKLEKIRLNFFNSEKIKKIMFQLNFIYEKIIFIFKKEMNINNLIFTSNYNTKYFLFQSKKFIEYQNIIPEKNIEKYLPKLKNLLLKYKPNVTLLHLKIFKRKGKGFEFTEKGLAIALHIICDEKFDKFFKKILKLDLRFNCKINLYKNSLINKKIIELFYPNYVKIFLKKIISINKNYKFINNFFKY